ncbi:MAG: tetratricopeptide repeat protein [Acidobacteria bacterium]|nr:tetratricopeptide repeat protein [Acidobacteriota bacterium]
MGLLLAEQGELAESLEHLERAAALLPQNARVHYNKGLAQQRPHCPGPRRTRSPGRLTGERGGDGYSGTVSRRVASGSRTFVPPMTISRPAGCGRASKFAHDGVVGLLASSRCGSSRTVGSGTHPALVRAIARRNAALLTG